MISIVFRRSCQYFSRNLHLYLFENSNFHVTKMSQKSILSFFQKQNIKTVPSTNTDIKESQPEKKETKTTIDPTDIENSPEVKKKRKRIVFIASDDEEEEINKSPKKEKVDELKVAIEDPESENLSKSPKQEKADSLKETNEEPDNTELSNEDAPVEKEEKVADKIKAWSSNSKTKTSSKKKTPNSAAKATKKQSQPKIGKTLFTSAKNSSETKTEGNTNEDTETSPRKEEVNSESPDQKEKEKSPAKKKSESPVESKKKKSPPKKKRDSPVDSKKKKSPTQKKSESSVESKNTPDEEKKESPAEKKPKPSSLSAFFISKNSQTETVSHEYNPDKKNYHPVEDASWKHGERVPYLALAKTLLKIEETSARLKIIEILSNYFRSVIVLSESDLLPSIYLCLNTLGPAYEGLELGIADTYLMKAVAQCTGRTLDKIKADVAKTGDLGIVAEQSRSNQKLMFRAAPLTVQNVCSQLTAIAKITGQSAIAKKIDKIAALFVACRECEARFVIRSLTGKMRIGLAEQSLLQALALACTTTPTNQEFPPEILNASKNMSAEAFKKKLDEEALILKTTFCECPNYNLIVPVLLKGGIESLPEHCKITPGLPVKPMLAQPTKGAREVLDRFENLRFTCEWKYDGERAQIHIMDDGKIKIYSRNQEDNTSKYPDIISNIREALKEEVKSCILDTEAVAWDREQKKIMPFQILSTRKRKNASETEIKVQVCVFFFDLLYLNGESFIQKPLLERREILKTHFQEVEGKFLFVTSLDINTMEEVQECLEESVKGNCEGLMVKTLDTEATYEIAKRSRNWLKLKKDYLEGVGDTLDLVVIGGYTGKGKRTGHYGGFLLASYDTDNEEYQAICKIGTGFSDEILAQHSEFLKQHVIPAAKTYYRCDSSLEPDHWFDAVQVWEVKCADLSLSPVYHSAIGLVDAEKGISLRFPRFLRIRTDKTPEEATSSQQVAELYKNQDQIKNQTGANTFNEEDF